MTTRETEMTPSERVDFAQQILFDALDDYHDTETIRVIGELKTELDRVALLAGQRLTQAGNTWAAKHAFSQGCETKYHADKQTRRTKTLCDDDRLADHLARGTLTASHIDVVSAAARDIAQDTTAIPARLLDEIASLGADQARERLSRWVADHTSNETLEAEYTRQRDQRRVFRHTNRALNLPGITIEGDKATIDRIYAELNSEADAAYIKDGGRDAGTPMRSTTQRRFDVAVDKILGIDATNTIAATPRRSRPNVVVTIDLERLLGLGAGSIAEQLGTGPLATTQLLEMFADDPILRILLQDAAGEPLWLGRVKRHANTAQFIALAIRDRGCVLCNAGIGGCVVHHIMPFNAPIKGDTDIDNLALLCQACHHHRVHNPGLTLTRDPNGPWKTRPALPQELPPPRPDT